MASSTRGSPSCTSRSPRKPSAVNYGTCSIARVWRVSSLVEDRGQRPTRLAVVVDASTVGDRAQSLGEEIANSVSHGTGFLAALIAFPVLLLGAGRHGALPTTCAPLFAATMALLYLTSTLYHSLAPHRA